MHDHEPVTITLQIIETIHYGAEFTLDELRALAEAQGVPAWDDPDYGAAVTPLEWAREVGRDLIQDAPRLQEQIEHESGDVQGQEWEWSA